MFIFITVGFRFGDIYTGNLYSGFGQPFGVSGQQFFSVCVYVKRYQSPIRQ